MAKLLDKEEDNDNPQAVDDATVASTGTSVLPGRVLLNIVY